MVDTPFASLALGVLEVGRGDTDGEFSLFVVTV